MMSDFQDTPCNRWLGFQLVHRSSVRVEITQAVRPEMLQEAGVVQGGLLTALADTAAVYLLWPDLGANRSMIGTSVTMQFLSAAILDDEPLVAIALPLRVGRRVAVCESAIHQGSRMIAKGTFTFLLSTK